MCKNNVITGVDISAVCKFLCEGYADEKHARQPFQKCSRRQIQPGELVYSAICVELLVSKFIISYM